MSGDVQIILGVDASQVKPGLDSVKGDFQGWAGNANAVASATQKLEQQLKGFASEQRTQARMSRFFAGEIASIIPAAGGARDAIQGLLSVGLEGLAGGLGIGVALEAAKFAIQGVVAAMERAEKASQALGDAGTAAARVIADGWDRVRATTEKATDASKAYDEASRAGSPNIEKAIAAKAKIEDLGAGLLAKVRGYIFGDPAAFDAYLSTLAAADREIQKAISSSMQFGEIQGALATEAQKAAQAGAANRVLADDYRRARERAAKAAADEAKEQDRISKLIGSTMERMGGAAEADRGNFPDMFYNQPTADALAASQEGQSAPMFGPGSDAGAAEFRAQLERINAESSQMQQLWSSIGNSVSSAFSGIGAAVGGVAGKVLAWLGQMISQAIALAVSMAAAGMAWSSPLGVVVTAGVVAAGLIGLIGAISARADGGPVIGMRPYLVGERGPELFVPGTSGNIVPNEQLGAGGNVSVVFNAPVDGAWWRRNERHIVRTLREASRGGRA